MTVPPEASTTIAELSLFAWLVAGVLMLLVEALGIPGVGFLFAGLGAMAVGGFLAFEVIANDAFTTQGAVWCAATALSALVLYAPLKRWQSRTRETYSNMVGTQAVAEEPGLTPGIEGTVRWSGTLMRARLAPDQPMADAGTSLRVVGMEGTVLILSHKDVAPR